MNRRLILVVVLVVTGLALATLPSCQRQTKTSATGSSKPGAAQYAEKPDEKGSGAEERRAKAEAKPPKEVPQKKSGVDVKKKSTEKGMRSAEKPSDASARVRLAQRTNSMKLMFITMYISRTERTGQGALNADQAKKVLAILTPLRSKPKLTDEEAGKVVASLRLVFTADQRSEIDKMMEAFSNRGQKKQQPSADVAGKQPGDGIPSKRVEWRTVTKDGKTVKNPPQGEPPPGITSRKPNDVARMRDFNPFYSKVPQGDAQAARRVDSMNRLFDTLEKKAK